MEGNPRFPTTQDIPDFPYARFAELIDLQGIHGEAPDAPDDAWHAALRAGRSAGLDGKTDADMAPFPPYRTIAQATGLLSAMAKGDAERGGAVQETMRPITRGITR